MATRRCHTGTLGAAMVVIFALALAIPAISAAAPPPPIANKNYTVGDVAGWFFNTSSNATSANYSDWAASKTFYLGDFLLFNTNTNSSVVQTNNDTTYNLCDASMDDGNQTFLWGNDGGDSSTAKPEVIAIPLVYEGPNYFFSETMDGEQCMNGMKFGIKVLHGDGLPPSLNQAPPPPPARPPPPGAASENENSGKNGVEGMRGGMVWAGMGMLSLVLMAM